MTAKQLGKYIRKLRRKRHITLPALAGCARISKGLLSRIENDGGNPGLDTLQKISTALRFTITIRP